MDTRPGTLIVIFELASKKLRQSETKKWNPFTCLMHTMYGNEWFQCDPTYHQLWNDTFRPIPSSFLQDTFRWEFHWLKKKLSNSATIIWTTHFSFFLFSGLLHTHRTKTIVRNVLCTHTLMFMGPHERKLDANDSTAGSELRERKKKNTRYRRTANEKTFSASAVIRCKLPSVLLAGWADHGIFPFFLFRFSSYFSRALKR